jgi:hypothetical protein
MTCGLAWGELAQEGAVIFLCLCASSLGVCVGGGSKIEHRCFSKEGDTYLIVTRLLFLLSERRASMVWYIPT